MINIKWFLFGQKLRKFEEKIIEAYIIPYQTMTEFSCDKYNQD